MISSHKEPIIPRNSKKIGHKNILKNQNQKHLRHSGSLLVIIDYSFLYSREK